MAKTNIHLAVTRIFWKKKPSNVSNTSSAQDSKLCGEEPKSLAPWPRALESKGSTTTVSQFTDHCWIWGCLKFGIHFVPWTSSCSSFSALKLPFGGISNCRIDHFETNPDCFCSVECPGTRPVGDLPWARWSSCKMRHPWT